MVFDKLAMTGEEEDMKTTSKAADLKYSMPQWCPSGLTRSQKRKLQRLRAKETTEKEVQTKGRRSKSNDHKNRGQNNSCTAFCRYGGQSGC
jgi:hypothetical protein